MCLYSHTPNHPIGHSNFKIQHPPRFRGLRYRNTKHILSIFQPEFWKKVKHISAWGPKTVCL